MMETGLESLRTLTLHPHQTPPEYVTYYKSSKTAVSTFCTYKQVTIVLNTMIPSLISSLSQPQTLSFHDQLPALGSCNDGLIYLPYTLKPPTDVTKLD